MMKNEKKVILGLVGHPSSGKDSVANYLVERYGFTHISLSNFIRQYIIENNLGEQSKEMWHNIGNMLREKYGPDYLVVRALETDKSRIVISGIRSIAEGDRVKESGGKILALTASIEFRYQLAKSRGRIGDDSFEKFKKIEDLESNSNDPFGMNVNKVMELADFTIQNDGPIEELKKNIDRMMKEINLKI